MTDSASDPRSADVLSSIRRLVAAAPAASAPRPSQDPPADRLLLTPALRVADPETPKSPSARPARLLTLEERIAELEAAVSGQPEDWEPDGSEVQEVHRPTEVLRGPLRLADPQAPEEEPEPRPEPEAAADGAAAVDPAPERVAAFPAPRAEPEPDALPDSADAAEDASLPAGLFFTRHDRRPAPEVDAAPDAPADQDDTGIAGSGDAPIRHHADASAPASADGTAEPDDLDTPIAEIADALIDGDMLHEMVAAIVREELQGPLGEKITRNIRKLVRREIERALTVRDYD